MQEHFRLLGILCGCFMIKIDKKTTILLFVHNKSKCERHFVHGKRRLDGGWTSRFGSIGYTCENTKNERRSDERRSL